MSSSAARKRKQYRKKKLIDELRGEISELKRELEEKEKRNPSSLVKENHAYFRNAVKEELSKFDWSGKNVNVRAGDFSESDMRDMDLEGMTATDAVFRGTDLKGAKLDRAKLDGADFTDAHFDRFTSFRGSNIKGAIFSLESLPLLFKIGLKGDNSYKVSFKDKGSYTVQNIDTFMKVVKMKFEQLLKLSERLEKDEKDQLKKAVQNALIESYGREDGIFRFRQMLSQGGRLDVDAIPADMSFDPNLDFKFDFKRRGKSITKEFQRLKRLQIPPELLAYYSISVTMLKVEKIMTKGLEREKIRSKSQSRGWKDYVPFL